MARIRKITSGTLATAVTLCRQKVSVPLRAEPRPRTRLRAVAMLDRPLEPIAHKPHQDRKRDRADDGRAGEDLDGDLVEALTGVPDEVADTAKHVVDQRPREQEEKRAPRDTSEEARDLGVSLRPCRDSHQPP